MNLDNQLLVKITFRRGSSNSNDSSYTDSSDIQQSRPDTDSRLRVADVEVQFKKKERNQINKKWKNESSNIYSGGEEYFCTF